MATIVDELIYKVGFAVDKESLTRLESQFKSIAKAGAVVAGAAAAAGGAIFALTNKVASQLDDMGEFAESIGISTTELQKLQFVAERTGVGAEGLNTSLRFMVKNLAEAADGNNTVIAALEKLGLSVEDLQGLAPEQQMKLISDGMSKMTDNGQRVAVAMDIFGKSGTAMVTMLKDGSAAIDAISGRMINLVPPQTIENASKFKDSMQEFNDILGAVGVTIAGELMPVFTEMVGKLREFFIQNREIIQMGLRVFFTVIYFVLRSIFEVIKAGVSIVQWFIDLLGGARQALNLLLAVLVLFAPTLLAIVANWAMMTTIMAVGRIFAVIDAIKALNLWLRITSISLKSLLVATGIGLLLLALQDLFAWVNGQPSLMGMLFGSFDDWWASFKGGLAALGETIKAWWDSPFMQVIKGVVTGMATGGVVGAVTGGMAAYSSAYGGAGSTTNNNVNTTNQVNVHGVNDPAAAAAMVDAHLQQRANTALATSNPRRM